VLRQIYDQMPDPKWVLAMGVCASSGGMFNNYAVVQGVDHIVPVDMYLPGCQPRPEMLMDAILKLHHKISNEPLGPKRERALARVEPGGAVALHSTERPYGGYFDEVTDALIEAVGQATYEAAVQRVLVDRGEITYFVYREYLRTLVQALRDDEALRFELCSSV